MNIAVADVGSWAGHIHTVMLRNEDEAIVREAITQGGIACDSVMPIQDGFYLLKIGTTSVWIHSDEVVRMLVKLIRALTEPPG